MREEGWEATGPESTRKLWFLWEEVVGVPLEGAQWFRVN